MNITNVNPLSAQEIKIIFKSIFFSLIMISCGSDLSTKQSFHDEALIDSRTPIHPGSPDKVPFWNTHAKRFIYAPSFNYKEIQGVENYLFKITSEVNDQTFQFTEKTPYAPLSAVWDQIPVGYFKIQVIGIENGEEVGISGEGRFYRASPFNGIYHKAILPYDQSAEKALGLLLEKDYVQYWLTDKKPDPNYLYYRYPTKMFAALIVGAVTYSKIHNSSDQGSNTIELAKIVADYLIDISFDEDSPLANFPPTYRGYEGLDAQFNQTEGTHMDIKNTMMPYGADAGHAYLDLYDITKNEKYFNAAKRIADTYLRTQLDNGSWYLFINNQTGEPTAPNIAIPTAIINYLNRLDQQYQVRGLEDATQRALKWTLANPVKTFNWQGQFEDVKASIPYENQSREQACELAIYLFKNNEQLPLAQELIRYAEDQFVIWEQPMPFTVKLMEQNSSELGYKSENWVTPCVQEQYDWWMPVSRSAGIMVDTYWEAYQATGNKIYLAKAKSLANSFTVVQQLHEGDYPTYFTKYQMGVWLNNTVYPAKVMQNFHENLQKIGSSY